MANPADNPKNTIREATEQLRKQLQDLRQNTVHILTRRNQMREEVMKQEQFVKELEAKLATAEQISGVEVAKQFREEWKRRSSELLECRRLLTQMEAQAEAARIRLPEEERQLLQQVQSLQSQLVEVTEQRITTSLETGGLSESGNYWERAIEKTRALENQNLVMQEMKGGKTPQGSAATTPKKTPDEIADEMLAEMEAKLTPSKAKAPSGSLVEALENLEEEASQPETKSGETPATPLPVMSLSMPVAPPVSTTVPAALEEKVPSLLPKQWQSLKRKAPEMEPLKRIRVAAIGTGGIFRGAHLPVYPDIAQAQLVAFCDPDPVAQKAVMARYESIITAKVAAARERGEISTADRLEADFANIKVYEDIAEVIASVKPDLVDICTQPMLHAPLSIQALEAGIHVMCEKPISRSWLESQRVLEAVNRSGKFYQHNENWLWDPDWYTAKKLIDAGSIGEPILMFLATAHGGPEGNPRFWNSDFGGGGALLDNGIHAIGASWFVSGFDKKPTYVKAAQPFGMSIRMPDRILDGRYQKVRVDDDAHILIRFENPKTLAWTTAHVEGSWSHRDSPDTSVIGTTGKILFQNVENRRYAVVYDAYERESRRIEVSGSNWQHWPSSFYGEILNMVECIRAGVPSISDAAFGADCSAIVGASYLSERDGRRAVHLEEFKTFAKDLSARYHGNPKAADDALVETLLSAVRKGG